MANRHMKRYSALLVIGNADQNHNEIPPHTCQNGCHQKRTKITNVGEDVEKRNPLTLFEGL